MQEMAAVMERTEAIRPIEPAESRVLLHNVSWKTYEALLADLEDCSAPRLTYDRGELEIMSPTLQLELFNDAVKLLMSALGEEWKIEIIRSAIRKFPLFAKIGIPEVWRYDGKQVTINLLRGGIYVEQEHSRVLPLLTSADLRSFLAQSREMDRVTWLARIRKWARAAKKSKKSR